VKPKATLAGKIFTAQGTPARRRWRGSAGHILVTGGAGFIGSHLVERLLAAGETVVVIDDLSTGDLDNLRAVKGHPKLRVVRSRISSCRELGQLAGRAGAIYHLAAAVGVELATRAPLRTLETNLRETEILLKAAASGQVPFLFTSSSEVYGKADRPEFREEDDLTIGSPEHSRWGYACSKLADEFLAFAYARERSLPIIIARLFNTVGPRQTGRYGMVLPRFIAAAKRGEPLRVFGDGRQRRCFCYVADTVEALIRLQNCPQCRGNVFNVGTTEEIGILELARSVVQLLESKSTIEFVPYHRAYGPGFEEIRRRKPSVKKLAAAIGFRPRISLREIILRTAAG
jgi:UDP-glucose 4-epimerase